MGTCVVMVQRNVVAGHVSPPPTSPRLPRTSKTPKRNVLHRPGIEPGASRINLKQMATANFTTKPPML
jgi:hypothetical protein